MITSLWALSALVSHAQDEDGPIGSGSQELVAGDLVSAAEQQRLGLVAVNGGCSGTLLNQYWVLTAHHCVAVGASYDGSLLDPSSVVVSEAWTGAAAVATHLFTYRFTDNLDVALIFLGEGDLGPANTHLFYTQEPDASLTVRKYGRGLASFASVVPLAPAVPDGQYRSGLLDISAASPLVYTVLPNAQGQIASGGDSGGVDIVEYDGVELGISGVQSSCVGSFLVPGDWTWATSISSCNSSPIYTVRDDIVSRIQEVPGGDVWVAPSNGGSFADPAEWWLSGFCTRDEVCEVADVNGDTLEDVIRFVKTDHSVRDSDVYVAYSYGSGFYEPVLAAESFCTLGETCDVGDVDGNGRADLISFVKTNHAANDSDVWVVYSDPAGFQPPVKVLDYFCTLGEVCKVGDMNGDGLDDLVSFVRTNGGANDSDVYVAYAYNLRRWGRGFSAPVKVHDYFCTQAETCEVGDMDGNGSDDLVSFVRTNHGGGDSDVWVSLSSPQGFGANQKWHDYFCTLNETCAIGNVNGDSRDDVISFVKTNNSVGDSDVWISLSWGNTLGAGEKWHDFFCTLDETCAVGDVTGDGRDDIISFVRGN